MLDSTQDKALNTVEEPQLDLLYQPIVMDTSSNPTDADTIRVLSLFSGCGGMDLGFEGGFEVLKDSVNELLHADFISRKVDSDFVQLRKTKFKTVFANDILTDARSAWVNFFTKRGHHPEFFFQESIVDLVKLHRSGTPVFPYNIDLVTGGFPCQDFSIAGKRNGFNSHKNHLGEIIAEESHLSKLEVSCTCG
jgi:DNA (cytosine-5)-methyltransferase 1